MSDAADGAAVSYEKLGLFYLGRPYDVGRGASKPGLTLYDSTDLTTHAVCVGMTGSGKTGLCVGLIEEAAIDGVPVLAIDPKGDLGNLLLTFPALSGADFRPWIDDDEAARQGLTPDEYATDRADAWRRGLHDWHQDASRIQRLRDAADFAIYTPGSNAGLPLSILRSFSAPPAEVLADIELLAERINTTATSLLTLAGVEAEPVRSREHVLLATVLRHAWEAGHDLDLPGLIQAIQHPGVQRVGVMDLDSFYPPKDRFELAMRINQLLAAPGFELWLEGDPLDVGSLLYTAQGKPRVSIVSIAHLGETERVSFVALLLNQVLGWMRAQSGTTSLRALLYMDEIYGYLPPVANPASKAPMLTLLKQARAYGVGIVLATQNPVDLDYKALSNAGTWFLGRLQTDRDKARVLDGLEGAAAGTGARFDRRAMEETLAGLSSRIFLMHNVHEDAPEVFETRWVMSYLRGPLTREQIRTLMAERRTLEAPVAAPPTPTAVTPATASGDAPVAVISRPVLPPTVPQYFLPAAGGGNRNHYVPMLYGAATVEFTSRKHDVVETRDLAFLVSLDADAATVDWDAAEATEAGPEALEVDATEERPFAELPASASRVQSYSTWEREFTRWLGRRQTLELMRCDALDMVSTPDESERDFRIRLRDRAREVRDETTAKLRKKYAAKIQTLTDRVRRAEQAVDRESEQASQQKLQTALSFGATVLSAVLGRRATTRSTLGRATTAARGVGRSLKEKDDVARARENVEALQEQLAALEAELHAAIDGVAIDPLTIDLEPVVVKTSSRKVAVRLMALVWTMQP